MTKSKTLTATVERTPSQLDALDQSHFHIVSGLRLIWAVPQEVFITSGVGWGETSLTAFDKALLDAGIGDLNLIRVTSIVPPGAKVTELKQTDVPLFLKAGMLAPTVYSSITSETADKVISSALAIGVPRDRERCGVIFEATRADTAENVRQIALNMVEEALKERGLEADNIFAVSAETTVTEGVGCALCAALMLPGTEAIHLRRASPLIS
jgi:arginine decarboxylase